MLWNIAIAATVWAERIKKKRYLITYQEVLAFWHGETVERNTPCGFPYAFG